MKRHWHSRPAPPWWPANEPWPPTRGAHAWRRGRARFMRRAGCGFAVLLMLAAFGAASLVSMILGRALHVDLTSRILVTASLAALILIIVPAIFFTVMRGFGSPFANLVDAADRVAGGDFSTRTAEYGPPPLRSVARAFNSMTERLAAQEEQRRHLMADIAHELRNPLTIIQGRLEGLLDGVYARDDQQLNDLLADTRVLARLIEDLRTLANAESGQLSLQKEPTDLAVLLQDLVNSFAADADARGVTMDVDAPQTLPLVDLDPLRIREVLANLLSNALRHTPAGGRVRVLAEVTGDRAMVKVVDTGAGILPEDLPKIFDRFYKTPGASGSGLGLTIARNLVVAHGGRITADSQPGEGTTIAFTLPLEAS